MTIEHRLIVDLREVRALRVECTRCHAAVSFRLDESISVPMSCPGCRTAWIDAFRPETVVIDEVVSAIKTLLRLTTEKPPCVLRLEVDAPPFTPS